MMKNKSSVLKPQKEKKLEEKAYLKFYCLTGFLNILVTVYFFPSQFTLIVLPLLTSLHLATRKRMDERMKERKRERKEKKRDAHQPQETLTLHKLHLHIQIQILLPLVFFFFVIVVVFYHY